MKLSSEQYVAMGQAAMVALIQVTDVMLFSEDELSARAWKIADAMGAKLAENTEDKAMNASAATAYMASDPLAAVHSFMAALGPPAGLSPEQAVKVLYGDEDKT
jgi:hypothetical protein